MNDEKSKRKRGRPTKYPMPEQIPDTPENVARVVMNTPPKKAEEYKFVKRRRSSS